jgi:hypothetical protein
MFWCSIASLAGTLTIRLTIRKAQPPLAQTAALAVYALVGAAGFCAATVWFHAALEAGVWAGLFVGFILDALLWRFMLGGRMAR